MSYPVRSNLDFGRCQIENAVIQNLSAAPSTPVEGLMYYDTTDHCFKYYNGTAWVSGATVDISDKADKVIGATNGHFAGLDTNGNLTDSGSKADDFDAAGAASTVQTNLTTHTGSTNNPHGVTKAQVGLENVTNESKATMFTSPAFTGTGTYNGVELATKNDISAVFKYKGTKTYAEIIALTTASVGDVWKDGESEYACIVANTAGASSWEELGTTVDLSAYAQTADVIQRVTGAAGKVPKLKTDGTVESTGFELGCSVPAGAVFTDTVYAFSANKKVGQNGTLTSSGGICTWTFTHNLNTRDVTVAVRAVASPYQFILVEVQADTVNTVKVLFVSASTIAANTYSITVVG